MIIGRNFVQVKFLDSRPPRPYSLSEGRADMKINDKSKCPQGEPLSTFARGDCIRLAKDVPGAEKAENAYFIVSASPDGGDVAIRLSDGCWQKTGRFVLEPNAKVVIE